jgi:hypothetical protein
MNSPYLVKQDGGLYDQLDDLAKAIDTAQVLFHSASEEDLTTFTVSERNGSLVASFTNRTIEGIFYKKAWAGPGGSRLQVVAQESFDATDVVLSMTHAELISLKDGDASSDELGKRFIPWDGPFEVNVVTPILEYFGVRLLKHITPEALDFAARQREAARKEARQAAEAQGPLSAPEPDVTLSIKVTVKAPPGAPVAQYLRHMVNSANSFVTSGVSVEHVQIESADNIKLI